MEQNHNWHGCMGSPKSDQVAAIYPGMKWAGGRKDGRTEGWKEGKDRGKE